MAINPFAETPPPEAVAAALQLQAQLRAGLLQRELSTGGKMFGVLLTNRETLYAFSGTLNGEWFVPGFAPPIFAPARFAFEPEGDRLLKGMHSARMRTHMSQQLMRMIHDAYVIAGVPLRDLWNGGQPPAGAGDCAAPKLIALAHARGLEPVAIAEFFWGEGSRTHGAFYPACRNKCEPILRFMLHGERARLSQQTAETLFEDAHVIAVNKPAGLLSVPGKDGGDSVLAQLQRRFAHALLAHRLDQDASGVLIAGKDAATYKALQRQFAERSVSKTYVAVLERAPAALSGEITLPMRPDIDDRPRQIVDLVHGKPAHSTYRVLDGPRVTLTPITGRTHQLRVHAAHALSPIVGDRLYGTASERLLLHAESLTFSHSGARLTVCCDTPF